MTTTTQTTQHEARARTGDPSTSHAAARSVSRTTEVREHVLVLLKTYGAMTDDQLCKTYAVSEWSPDVPRASVSGIRTRRAELAREGRVVDTGRKRRTPGGRAAIVWAAA